MDAYEARLKKIRLLLMSKPNTVFFVSLAYKLKFEVSTRVATAATNGTTIIFNPDFMDSLTDDELLFLMLHEIMHVVLMHLTRLGDREHRLWNCAGDYVINLSLVDQGFKMPEMGLLDRQYRGMSTEEVYEKLQEDSPDEECPMPDLMDPSGSNGDSEPGEGSSGSGSGAGGNLEEIKQQISNIVAEATSLARMSGEEPGKLCPDMARTIKEIFSTQVDWRKKLQKSISGKIKRKSDWLRPNKRYLPHYLPRTRKLGVGSVTVLIDVSGSITHEAMSTYMGEVFHMLRVAKPRKVEMFFFAWGVTDSHVIKSSNDIKAVLHKEINSNYGTSLHKALQDLEDHSTDLMLILSDGYFDAPDIGLFNKNTRYIACFTTDYWEDRKMPWEHIRIELQI
jgi:predicted metal-dependent peptidase